MSCKFNSIHPGKGWNILEFYFFIFSVRTCMYSKCRGRVGMQHKIELKILILYNRQRNFFSRFEDRMICNVCSRCWDSDALWQISTKPLWFLPRYLLCLILEAYIKLKCIEMHYSRTPDERPPSPTTIPLIRPYFVWRTVRNSNYLNPLRATIPLIRPHQCDSDGGRIRGILL